MALAGLAISQAGIMAQDYAPDSMTGSRLTVTVTGGSAPFVTGGDYKLFMSAAGTNYVVLGRAGAGFGWGTYHYSKTDADHGVLTFLDLNPGREFPCRLLSLRRERGLFRFLLRRVPKAARSRPPMMPR